MPRSIDDEVFEEYIESNRVLTTLLMKEVHQHLNEYTNLQHAAFVILKILHAQGPLSQHKIAVHMCHTDASVSKLVLSLVEKRYVTTRQDPQNRRRVVVEITPRGEKELQLVKTKVLAVLKTYFDGLTNKKLIELTTFNKELHNKVLAQQKENNG